MEIVNIPGGYEVRQGAAFVRCLARKQNPGYRAVRVHVPVNLSGQGLATKLYQEAYAEANRRGGGLVPGHSGNPAIVKIRTKVFPEGAA